MSDPCQKYLFKNKSNKYLLSFKTNKGQKYIGNFSDKKHACQKLKDFLEANQDVKILNKYCYY